MSNFKPTTEGFSAIPDGGTVASGTGATQMFALVSNMSSLALEIRTGMKRSRGTSVCKWAYAQGLTKRSGRETVAFKRAVLMDLVKARQGADPSYVPTGTIAAALDGE